jgi:hypothetical protein
MLLGYFGVHCVCHHLLRAVARGDFKQKIFRKYILIAAEILSTFLTHIKKDSLCIHILYFKIIILSLDFISAIAIFADKAWSVD